MGGWILVNYPVPMVTSFPRIFHSKYKKQSSSYFYLNATFEVASKNTFLFDAKCGMWIKAFDVV